jgi:hypothetical protein
MGNKLEHVVGTDRIIFSTTHSWTRLQRVPFDRQRTSVSGNLMRVVEQAPALITLYRKSVELVLLVIGVLRDPLILW